MRRTVTSLSPQGDSCVRKAVCGTLYGARTERERTPCTGDRSYYCASRIRTAVVPESLRSVRQPDPESHFLPA